MQLAVIIVHRKFMEMIVMIRFQRTSNSIWQHSIRVIELVQ